ncbi:exported protein of unknown function [Methylotuvimicrobium alcaliphilum 20Z]|uniref:Uncharacterized protein n=1 Tax=Methylotuvimicrobium alcaliphilum (strain DSM 19304 / NCIMB 14124 / VKM B-2133 / 20Z) TaxID=1091494 RepID=G4SX35_META2|nr:exported protein of unknown function [Methylotuvimicrobium alcaliphilum 20Z]
MKFKSSTILFYIAIFSLNLGSFAQADESKDNSDEARQMIVRFNSDSLTLYHRDGTSFNRIGEATINDLPTLPIPIVESSSAGYVLINGDRGMVWLDQFDIGTTEKPLVTATCDRASSYSIDYINTSVPGNNDGCK